MNSPNSGRFHVPESRIASPSTPVAVSTAENRNGTTPKNRPQKTAPVMAIVASGDGHADWARVVSCRSGARQQPAESWDANGTASKTNSKGAAAEQAWGLRGRVAACPWRALNMTDDSPRGNAPRPEHLPTR